MAAKKIVKKPKKKFAELSYAKLAKNSAKKTGRCG